MKRPQKRKGQRLFLAVFSSFQVFTTFKLFYIIICQPFHFSTLCFSNLPLFRFSLIWPFSFRPFLFLTFFQLSHLATFSASYAKKRKSWLCMLHSLLYDNFGYRAVARNRVVVDQLSSLVDWNRTDYRVWRAQQHSSRSQSYKIINFS